jgi:hypothetical protein
MHLPGYGGSDVSKSFEDKARHFNSLEKLRNPLFEWWQAMNSFVCWVP